MFIPSSPSTRCVTSLSWLLLVKRSSSTASLDRLGRLERLSSGDTALHCRPGEERVLCRRVLKHQAPATSVQSQLTFLRRVYLAWRIYLVFFPLGFDLVRLSYPFTHLLQLSNEAVHIGPQAIVLSNLCLEIHKRKVTHLKSII